MKRSAIIAFLVLALTAAFASTAGALNGYVYVGGGTYDFSEMYFSMGGTLQVNDRLAVLAFTVDPHTEWGYTGFEVSYGRDRGVYAGTYFSADGEFEDFYAGVFFRHAVSDSFQIRTNLGVYVSTDYHYVTPEAWVTLKYDLDGPFALLATIEDWAAGVALAYEF